MDPFARILALALALLVAAPLAGCREDVDAGTDDGVATTLEMPQHDAGAGAADDRPGTGNGSDDGDREPPPAYDQVSASDAAAGNEPYEYVEEQGDEPAQTETIFRADQLEQMVAPIALYPDSLMMQILMAATYPTEVVLADQWVKENKDLAGEQLDQALAEQNWDDSVKTLVRVPDVLSRLANNLDWTRDLGDAFLAQKNDVLNAIQVMRNRACDLGNLKTTAEQEVIREPYEPPPVASQTSPPPTGVPAGEPPLEPLPPGPAYAEVPPPAQVVRIVPTNPELVHVPIYSPRLVYGPPPPTLYYPAVFAPPPGYVATAAISFGVGLSVGAFLWTDLDWHRHRVLVRHYPGGFRGPRFGYAAYHDLPFVPWRHSYHHRRGVAYRSPGITRRYSSVTRTRVITRDGGRSFGVKGDRGRHHGHDRGFGKGGRGGGHDKDGRGGGAAVMRGGGGGKHDAGKGGGKSVERGKGSGKSAAVDRGKGGGKSAAVERGKGGGKGSSKSSSVQRGKGSSKSSSVQRGKASSGGGKSGSVQRGKSSAGKGGSSVSRGKSSSGGGKSGSSRSSVSKGGSKSRGSSVGSSRGKSGSGRSSVQGSRGGSKSSAAGRSSKGGGASKGGGSRGGGGKGGGGKGGGKH